MTRHEHWALWHADPRATPFQSPAWIEAWWQHLGGGERIDVAVRDSDRLVAALPMTFWHDDQVRRLIPIAAGQSDYCDVLIAPGVPVVRLWQALLTTQGWDEVLLPDLRPGSPLLGPVPDGWRATDEPSEVCPVLTLPNGDLLAGMTKSRRRKIVHDRHRAEQLGGVTTTLAGPDKLEEVLDALFEIHAARWEAAGEAGVLADPRLQAFLRESATGLAEAGLLRLMVVRHEGRIVCVLLGFADANASYSYINGVDLTIPGQSFGTLAFAALIERAVADRATTFHFLRGEEPYKYAWGAELTRTVRRTIRRA